VPSSPRDKDATWRTTGPLCRERGWSKRRLIYELQNGLPYKTFPPGHTFDWSDPYLEPYLNVEASEISFPSGVVMGAINEAVALVAGRPRPPKRRSPLEGMTIGIEVLPPGAPADAEVPAPSADAPVALPAPRRPSDAAVEQCFRDIMAERPNDPPDEEWLLSEMTLRLGAPPRRERVRNLWKTVAPEWKKPVGHPRNFNSAKKSAE
jgi:hypothetical protein